MSEYIYTYNGKRIAPSNGKVLGKVTAPPSVTYNIELSWGYDIEPLDGSHAYFHGDSITTDLTMYYRDVLSSWIEMTSEQKAALLDPSTKWEYSIYGLRITGVPSLSNWSFAYDDMDGYEGGEGYARVTDSNGTQMEYQDFTGFFGSYLDCTRNDGGIVWECDGDS